MPKVAHYTPVYLPMTMTWLYGQVTRSKAFDAFVVCEKSENLDQFPKKEVFSYHDSLSLPVRCYFRARYRDERCIKFYERVLESQRPLLLHAHMGYRGYEMLPLAGRASLPLVTSFYGVDASRLVQVEPEWVDRYSQLFSEGAAFIAEGSHMGRTLESLGCESKKIRVVRLGIDLSRFPYKERSAQKGIRILAAGTFREKKGHAFTIKAFGIAARKYPDLSLTIIGDAHEHRPYEMKEKRNILAEIDAMNLKDRVKLAGYQPYDSFIRELYNHHIFISPSVHAGDGDNEGGAPVSIIEASASGMPILSTTHCDIPEVVLDGESGYLVTERDAEALADRLLLLLDNPDSWATLGACGRTHIEQDYDLEKQVPKLDAVYLETLGETPQ